MKSTSYFLKAFYVLVIATVVFFSFKEVLPKKLFPEQKKANKNIVVDSLMLEAVAEADNDINKANSDTLPKAKKPELGVITDNDFLSNDDENFNGNQYLISFYEKLYQLETTQKGKVRIAYFGDSMTDGDMIVKDFRTYLQAKFGGNGVGFVSITSESSNSRSSLLHEFSSNWKMQSYVKTKRPLAPFGVNGHVFFTQDSTRSTWVRYKATKTRFATRLNKPTLFFGKSKNKGGTVFYVSGTDTIVKKIEPNNKLNTLRFSAESMASLKLNFKATDNIPFYGFNFDDEVGVHVDNFSSRGNSGLPLSIFSKDMMQAFQEKLGYNLIILHYGTNVLNYGSLNYSWYQKRMQKVVEHLRQCFPNVAILIVSTADKATKYNLEMKTDLAVVPLMTAQKRYAIDSKSGFVNLFELMGGCGSMVKWVEEIPAKANKDYTHFNFRGASEVAKMLYDQIEVGYLNYKKAYLKTKTGQKMVISDSINYLKDSVNVK